MLIGLWESARYSIPLWLGTTKDWDVTAGPVPRVFAHLLILLTHLLAPHCFVHAFLCTDLFAGSLTQSLSELVGSE